MSKVLSAQQVSQALCPAVKPDHAVLDRLVLPTASELLALTQAALADVDATLKLTPAQKSALSAALRARLAADVGGP